MKTRLHRIDLIRGITLISMILFHFMWDLKYIALYDLNWYTGLIGHIWQRSICISFILLSGFSFSLGKRPLKRNLITFICGAVVTIVTLVFMPENKVIFGVLTFLGSSGLIMIPFDRLLNSLYKRIDVRTLNLTLLIGNFLFFIVFYNINDRIINLFYKKLEVPQYMYKGHFATYLGFTDPTFSSTDYFSILPWIFIYFIGYFLYKLLCSYEIIGTPDAGLGTNKKSKSLKDKRVVFSLYHGISEVLSVEPKLGFTKFLEFIGRNTLIIYMLHQPVLYLITLIIMKLR